MIDDKEAPALGSAEAAVRSCVSLMAAVMGQREELLAYWCDLYYQVRAAYERERAPEPDPTVLRRGDLYPVLRELMADALKSAVRGEAKARCEKKAAAKETRDAEGVVPYEKPRVITAQEAAEAEETGNADAESAPP